MAFWFVAGRKLLGVQHLSRTTTLIKEIGIIEHNPLVEINIWRNCDHRHVYIWTTNVPARTEPVLFDDWENKESPSFEVAPM